MESLIIRQVGVIPDNYEIARLLAYRMRTAQKSFFVAWNTPGYILVRS